MNTELRDLARAVDDIKDNHLMEIYRELGSLKGRVSIVVILGIAAFVKSFFG